MPTIAARGLRFHTRAIGAGPPVVMLHGLLTGSLASWYFSCAPRLAERCEVHLHDLRGHGRSDVPPTGYGSASMAEDLRALTTDLDPFSIVAHSYGCLVAARFAASHPDRVRGLALVEPPFGLDLDGFDIDEVVAAGRALPSRQFERLTRLVTETSILSDVAAEPGLTDGEIAALPTPLLVVFGEDSPCRIGVEAVERSRPDAQVVVLPGDHEVHLRSTHALTALLVPFLAGSHREAVA